MSGINDTTASPIIVTNNTSAADDHDNDDGDARSRQLTESLIEEARRTESGRVADKRSISDESIELINRTASLRSSHELLLQQQQQSNMSTELVPENLYEPRLQTSRILSAGTLHGDDGPLHTNNFGKILDETGETVEVMRESGFSRILSTLGVSPTAT